MNFASLQFYFFLICIVAVYWCLPNLYLRRRLLVLGSFTFYAFWEYRFFVLLLISAAVDYFAARAIAASTEQRQKKTLLVLSLTANLVLLGIFKYFYFFTGSLNLALQKLGFPTFPVTIEILLPLGISFYTFQTMAYTIDVYRGRVAPRESFLDYFLFVSYFPQLVAGPIERYSDLMPQFFQKRELTLARCADAILLIGFGLMMKIMIADNLGSVVEFAFESKELTASLGWVSIFSFGYQIYVDFWSYTMIARGASKLFGIELSENFRQPYLAATPSNFWRRWHITLSIWFRDYLYIPLGGNKHRAARNLLLVMTIAGLWHGASVLFLLWGFYHGVLLVLSRHVRAPAWLTFPFTFVLINLGWVLFRAQNIPEALKIYSSLLNFTSPPAAQTAPIVIALTAIGITILIDLAFRKKFRLSWRLPGLDYLKFSAAGAMIMLIVYLGETSATPFIYFNF